MKGSPPHGRGKVTVGLELPEGIGITPAWAGKSDKHQRARSWLGDHPRMGGEKSRFAPPPLSVTGSPPHGRGKALWSLSGQTTAWITPAWAGKRELDDSGRRLHQDHPRMGGEKGRLGLLRGHRPGSPPHGRGKGSKAASGVGTWRITPAWAGKSTAAKHCANGIRDHPRMGGEKTKKIP